MVRTVMGFDQFYIQAAKFYVFYTPCTGSPQGSHPTAQNIAHTSQGKTHYTLLKPLSEATNIIKVIPSLFTTGPWKQLLSY